MREHINESYFGELIYSYTREQALNDGVLVDVSNTAREAGFKIPVALTAGVWEMINNIPSVSQGIEDVSGRLWDVLWMAVCAARINPDNTVIMYNLELPRLEMRDYRVVDKETGQASYKQRLKIIKTVTLKMVVGPGDHGEPIITIMLPNED